MRKATSIIVHLLLFFTFQVTSQEIKQRKYLIDGHITGVDSGMIRMFSGTGDSVLDSSPIMNGKFVLQGEIGLPERRLFKVVPGDLSFQAFVEGAALTFSIDTAGAQYHGHGSKKWALIWEIKEKGSTVSGVYERYKSETNQKYYASTFSVLVKKLATVKGNEVEASRIEQEIDSVKKLAFAAQAIWIRRYIHSYPTSIAGVYLFNAYYKSSLDTTDAHLTETLDVISGAAKASIYYKQLADIATNLKHIYTGSLAPDFTLLTKDQRRFALSTTRGRYVLLDFWASWCAPCRAAIPKWKKIYAIDHSKGFEMVSISDDRNRNDWKRAIEKEQMPWMQVIDEFPKENDAARVGVLYGVKTLPFYVLIDKEGKVILASGNEDTVIKKIEEILVSAQF